MEFLACLIGGLLLVGCGLALFQLRPPNWHAEDDLMEVERGPILWWARLQRGVRISNNVLLCLTGILISTTAFVPHGRTWMLLWGGILLLLLACIAFAMLDALSSIAGYKRALPVAARQSFGTHELSDYAVQLEGGSSDEAQSNC